MLTNWCAAVQVPQVVQFIRQFDQFGLVAAMRRVLHLQTLPLLFGQTFVIRHLLNDPSNLRSKRCLELCRSGVRVLQSVVKQRSLRAEHNVQNTAPLGLGSTGSHTCNTLMSAMPPSWLRILATPLKHREQSQLTWIRINLPAEAASGWNKV